MSLITNLRDLFQDAVGSGEPAPDHEERLTVAALLLLVAHADGRFLEAEEKGLPVLLRSYFGISNDSAARLLEQAAEINDSMDPATSLAERIHHDIPADERPRLLALAYRLAAVDGQVHEFEDDLVWRIGHLLGFSDGDIGAFKDLALRNLIPGQARG
jgi:uncharacterized tellurite resistance protein B-like protein